MANLWAAYLAGEGWLGPLVSWPWGQIDWRAVVRERALYPVDRKALAEALSAQNASYAALDASLAESLRLLEADTTFVVVTGQQIGWLTGPLYTIYKAVSAIQAARHIEAQLGEPYRVVPLFWMASEDHDAAEVNWVALSWRERLVYQGAFRGPVGRHRIGNAFPAKVQGLALQLYYERGQRWEEAFRAAFYELFRGTGLVVLSPDDAKLKSLAQVVWVQELEEGATLKAHAQAAAYLRSQGISARLHPQPINLFWLEDEARVYVRPEERQAALRSAHVEPIRLSPNVLLRPVFQECILPNLAYIGGPGELAYWLELRPVFDRFGVFFPVLWPRLRAWVVDRVPEALEAFLEVVFTQSWGAFVRSLIRTWEGPMLSELARRLAANRPAWEAFADLPQSQAFLRRLWFRWAKVAAHELYKVLRQKHTSTLEALRRWRFEVEPEGRQQERVLNVHAITQEPTRWVQTLLQTPHQPGRWHVFRVEGAAFLQEALQDPL